MRAHRAVARRRARRARRHVPRSPRVDPQSSARSAHGPPAPPTDRAATFHRRRRARGAHGRSHGSGGCALGACGSIRSDRAAMTSPPSARASARRSSASESARRTFSSDSGHLAGSMRSTASALDGVASAGDDVPGRSSSERSASPERIAASSAGGVGQPLDRDARGRARRAAEVDRIRPAHAPQVDQRRGALDHAVAAGRLARKQSRNLPVRRSVLDRTRDRHGQARHERRVRALERERDLAAVGAHAAQVRVLAVGEGARPDDVLEERRTGRARRRVQQALEGGANVLGGAPPAIGEVQSREQLEAERAASPGDDRQVAGEARDDDRAGQARGIRVTHERRAERVHDRARLPRRGEGRVERRQRLCRHHAQASGRRAREAHAAGSGRGAVVPSPEARPASAGEDAQGRQRQRDARRPHREATLHPDARRRGHDRSLDDARQNSATVMRAGRNGRMALAASAIRPGAL